MHSKHRWHVARSLLSHLWNFICSHPECEGSGEGRARTLSFAATFNAVGLEWAPPRRQPSRALAWMEELWHPLSLRSYFLACSLDLCRAGQHDRSHHYQHEAGKLNPRAGGFPTHHIKLWPSEFGQSTRTTARSGEASARRLHDEMAHLQRRRDLLEVGSQARGSPPKVEVGNPDCEPPRSIGSSR